MSPIYIYDLLWTYDLLASLGAEGLFTLEGVFQFEQRICSRWSGRVDLHKTHSIHI